jgi:hypothetical protein
MCMGWLPAKGKIDTEHLTPRVVFISQLALL